MSDYPMLISNKLHSFRNFGIQDKYFPRESALCAMYPFARSSFLLLKHKVYLLTGYIRIIRSTDADVLLP